MGNFFLYLFKTKDIASLAGFFIVFVFISTAVGAHLLVTWESTTKVFLGNALLTPSHTHLLGTDEMGRDLVARIIWGARISLIVAILSVTISLVTGVFIGAMAGYYEGRLSFLIMRIMDSLIAFPRILLAMIFITIMGTGITSLTIAIGLSTIPIYARLVRGPVLSLKRREFVVAARSLGAGDISILFKHILPNTLSVIIVQGTISLADAILIASGLSFLGLGPQPPIPEWGAMIATSRPYIRSYPHVIFAPGIALFAVILGFNILGDGLRDYLDPRFKKSR
jgi:ABC-type dipeptide/oligopeptide/nickel transport system permease subunit